VKDPLQALEQARRAAAAAAGGEAERAGFWGDEGPVQSAERLADWAIIEPDLAKVYSTRRFGAPLTALKLKLIQFLAQYTGQVIAQQSRFNAVVAAHIMGLEERVARLERAARQDESGPTEE
jgi:hypothetical protein